MLMGADHLCALAVVAAPGEGSDSRSGESRDATKKHIKTFVSSLLLGLRWGIGHVYADHTVLDVCGINAQTVATKGIVTCA